MPRLAVYLTGATLFLSLILARVFYIVLDFIHVQENFSALQQKVAKQSGASGEAEELRKRINELEVELRASQAKDRDFGGYNFDYSPASDPSLQPR
jgi:cell division protein FtsL